MIISKITEEECKSARSLWEEVFYEDSVQFTDYYFENKAEKNIGYVISQAPFDAMMFRTPYTVQIGEIQKEISYIVGVATRKECRHRGYMRELLMHSFREMYQEKNPFTFLMPADSAIYEPFDFKYIYERDVWQLKEPDRVGTILEALTDKMKEELNVEEKHLTIESLNVESELESKGKKRKNELRAAERMCDSQSGDGINCELTAAEFFNNSLEEYGIKSELNGLYSVRNLHHHFPRLPVLEFLAEFANGYLKEHYNIYVHRDASYYEMQIKESKAQNGDIYVWFEQNEIKAFFLYAKEEDIFLQEVMEEIEGTLAFLQKAEKKKPIIMARIIHLEEMMKLVCSKENTTMVIEIEDELIPENAGIYHWEITPEGNSVTKICSKANGGSKGAGIVPEVSMHIRDFAPWVLNGVFINEIV